MASTNPIAASSLGSTESVELAKKPILKPPDSIGTRLILGTRLWIFKVGVWLALRFLYTFRASSLSKIGPTRTKTYPVRPTLTNRIFYPSSYNPSTSPPTKLPLYIDIHGGGFALADPQTDDRFCYPFANKHNILVVSINYRKAPSYPFPHPVHDCAEITRAILADDSLPIDHSRITIGGFSAGANLALAIAQLDGIRDRIQAVVPVYPVVDFSGRYKGVFAKNKSGESDMLENTAALFDWGYVGAEVDRTDPLLSTVYASREELPQKIFFVGAENDYLCHEAGVMARKLAGIDVDRNGDIGGIRAGAELGDEWEKNGIRWKMVHDVQHGFTHVDKKGEEEKKRQKVVADLYEEIANWLRQDVWR